MKKLTAIILLTVFVFTALISCENEKGGETQSTTTAEVSGISHVIAENGESDYIIIRGENAKDIAVKAGAELYTSIKEKTDASIKFKTDFVKDGEDTSDKKEILFGSVNRPECRLVYSEINYDGYAIRLVDNKIVIAAYTDEKLLEAKELFLNECLRFDEDGKKVTFVKEIVEKGSEELFFNAENKLEDYRVVYSSTLLKEASMLVKYIKDMYGITLDMVSYKDGEQEKEILVGDTGRTESKKAVAKTPMGFVFKTDGSKIVINSIGDSAMAGVMSYINENYIRTSPAFNFPKNVNVDAFAYYGPESNTLTPDADIRVMSFNILSEEWDAAAGITPRIYGIIGTIKYYSPDVIGIQEVSKQWYSIIRQYLGDEYIFVNSDILSSTDNNYTALAYNKNKVKLLRKEVTFYSVYNSKRLRSINFGAFQTLDTGKVFAVTNTHFNANHGGDNTKQRETQAREFVAKINAYSKQYNCPIIMCGDYNSKDEASPYKIISDAGFLEAKKSALSKGKVFATIHDLGKNPGAGASSIDHIFHIGKAKPLYYTTLCDDILKISSDHCPIFADFKLE